MSLLHHNVSKSDHYTAQLGVFNWITLHHSVSKQIILHDSVSKADHFTSQYFSVYYSNVITLHLFPNQVISQQFFFNQIIPPHSVHSVYHTVWLLYCD